MFGLFKKKPLFSDAENARIVEAIKSSEQLTSGEIRIYIESKNPLVSTIDRASEIFFNLKMQETAQRNAVLLYLAYKDKEVAKAFEIKKGALLMRLGHFCRDKLSGRSRKSEVGLRRWELQQHSWPPQMVSAKPHPGNGQG